MLLFDSSYSYTNQSEAAVVDSILVPFAHLFDHWESQRSRR